LSDEWFFDSGRRNGTRRRWLSAVILILVIANMGVLAFFAVEFNNRVSDLNRDIDVLQRQLTSVNSEISSLRAENRMTRRENTSQSLLLTQIYNQTQRSVVLVSIIDVQWGPVGLGSGFVYDSEGRIITNNHVVEDAVKNGLEVEVTFIDGTVASATVVGTDPYVDLGVIDVDVDESILRPVTLGDSSELLVGEQVVAIGNPYGLADSMTTGIVSAVGRQMEAPGHYAIVDVIQTDAAINPGNSGGPLLNMRGEVVGMNTAIISETGQFSGIGYAIPSETIKREINSLIETGSYQHPRLGIVGRDVTPSIAKKKGLKEGTRGALIVDVNGEPAEKAGLRSDDVIIAVDDHTIRSFYDLVVYLERYCRPGDTVTLTLIRDNSVMELKPVLGVRPAP